MKKLLIVLGIAGVAAGGAYYFGVFGAGPAQGTTGQATEGAGAAAQGRGGFGGRGRGAAAGPMTVEVTLAKRTSMARQLVVVGNLIGDATVAVVPRTAGRLQEISVRLGDTVRRGQRIAKIEDFELQEQVKQQEAALEVALATIRQREADLQLAATNAERSRNLFARELLPKQTLDDTEARYQAAVAQLDLARAQNAQSRARLDELRINLANTIIVSPVDGFVARRAADPGAFVSQNAPIVDVVDISRVRLVANIVERDLSQIQAGEEARVEVDAFPGEVFNGRIARVSPVLDPSTRTAPVEIEAPNPGFRLKPGMYARVTITTDQRKDALVVPSNAVVDYGGRRGVFLAPESDAVLFRVIRIGIEERDYIEVLDGLSEGDRVVTTGAAALRDGDRVLVADATGGAAGARNAADRRFETFDGPSREGPGQFPGDPPRAGEPAPGGRDPADGAAGGRRSGGVTP